MISRQIDLTINKMTKAQYNGISPVADEVYVITDEAGCVTSVNGIQPDSSGNVTINIPSAVTESTVAGWGFTKNVGTVTSVNGVSPTNGNVAITLPTVNNGVLTLTQGGSTLGTFGANQSRNSVIDIPSGGSSRNIGEIVASTIPLTDAGLHLLDGALIDGYGIYSKFVEYIASIYDASANYFCTEAQWQTSVNTYGVCGKFVYDSVANTVRLPKVTGILEGTTDATALGDLVEAGLPNHNHYMFANTSNSSSSDARQNQLTNTQQVASWWYSGYASYVLARTDSQADVGISGNVRNNSIYGNSSTVQPQTIKCYYYIVIATSTKTDIQVDIDEIATDLNSKADTDFTNCTDVANIKMAHNAMPSDKYIDLTLGASGTTYTAPANGYIFLNKSSSGAGQYVDITNDASKLTAQQISTANYQNLPCFIECRQGDSFTVKYTAGGTLQGFRFVYAQGSESEAN